MMNKVVRFKGNTRFVPKEAGNLYIDGDKAVLIDQAGHEFVFARYGSDGQGGESGDGSGGAEYVENWPENPVQNRLYVTSEGARVYYGSNGEYVELAASGSQGGSSSGSGDQQQGGTEYVSEWPSNPVANRLYVTNDGARMYYGSNGEYVEFASNDGEEGGLTEYVSEWPSNPVANHLYVTDDGARMYYGGNGEYVEFASNDGQQNQQGGAEYVDEWPDNPVPNRLYVTSDGARIYHGDNGEYVELAVSNGASQRPVYTITEIPPETTQYIVFDSVSDENSGSWQYVHEPSTYAIYVLPTVDDATVEHCAIVTVKFTESQSVAFVDQRDFENPDPNFLPTIQAVNDVEVSPGAVVEYLCKYDPLQSKWVITAAPMN